MAPDLVRNIVLGELHVSDEPGLVICTTVGSCVAACLFDPVRGLGGMNHFLLPDGAAAARDDGAQRYGVHLMELLINSLLSRGASRTHLQAKAFGGASLTRGLTNAGASNVEFVEWFLRVESIPLVGGSVRGTQGRRVQFWPNSGRARQMLCAPIEVVVPRSQPPAVQPHGELELF
ncbi:chemotaxis protein CheD [Rubellimicrobium aerolatum]|uniref:Probable chemoreceptor glutamine deamidase CheD n=1 Tax=Rubellimicrobium aerolatum TaxID=490979 RepID=A0ABW0SH21_9RHOB|nr:chemotaxis protein CheD [Rubellimicrobium aerolatum]MBP1807581.1 chemotaxis protein CheD [Rubellimicrobium aerolatum]